MQCGSYFHLPYVVMFMFFWESGYVTQFAHVTSVRLWWSDEWCIGKIQHHFSIKKNIKFENNAKRMNAFSVVSDFWTPSKKKKTAWNDCDKPQTNNLLSWRIKEELKWHASCLYIMYRFAWVCFETQSRRKF